MSDFTEKVLEYLKSHCLGRQNANTGATIADALGSNWRAVAEAMRELRISRILVGSSKFNPAGYYLPVTEAEKRDCLATYKSELHDMLHVYNLMKKTSVYEIQRPKQVEWNFGRKA